MFIGKILVIFLVMLVPRFAEARQLVDGIAARVDGHLILWNDVAREAASSRFSGKQTVATLPDTRERMIEDILVADEAERLHLGVGDEEIDKSIDRLAQENHLDRPALQAEIARQGILWSDYRKMVGKQLLRSRIIQTQIRPKVVVGESDILSAWKSLQKGTGSVEFHLALTDDNGVSTDLGWNKPATLREEIRKAVLDAQRTGKKLQKVTMNGKQWVVSILATRIPKRILSKDKKGVLRQELFKRRLEKAFKNWLSSLKARHFVERKPVPASLSQP